MAKIVITAALFLAMVAMASAYTTITTVVVEENTGSRYGGSQQMCQQQFMEQQELQQCKMYLQQAQPYIEMVPRRPMLQDEQLKMQCCKQLKNMNEECRCPAIWEMVKDQQQGRRQMGEMTRMALELPHMCDMEPHHCQF